MKKLLIFIVLFCIAFCSCDKGSSQSETVEETIHTHTYNNGACISCGSIDELYMSNTYNDLTYKMSHLESYVDVVDLKKLIDSLPDSYRNVETISYEYEKIFSLFQQIQKQHLESLSNMIRDEDEKVVVDYDLVKSCFNDLLSLERHLDCDWSIKPALNNFFNDGLCDWACAFFKGYYSNSDDFYLSFMESNKNSLLFQTNLPSNRETDIQYSWTIEYGDIYYVPEGSDSKILAFKIQDFTENTLQIYCYKNTTVYTLYYHPVETACNHFFSNGSYCLYCSYYKG